MRQAIVDYVPWLLSCLTITASWLTGNKDQRGWLVSLSAQVGWLVWIFASHSWGFMPLNLLLWMVYVRNYRAWSRGAQT